MPQLLLDLDTLSAGMSPGLTPALGIMMAEAAAVALEHNGHRSGVKLKLVSENPVTVELRWQPPHPDAQRAHRDLSAAVEEGACGIALLLATRLTGYLVVERSFLGTGIDYWLGEGNKARLRRLHALKYPASCMILHDLQGVLMLK